MKELKNAYYTKHFLKFSSRCLIINKFEKILLRMSVIISEDHQMNLSFRLAGHHLLKIYSRINTKPNTENTGTLSVYNRNILCVIFKKSYYLHLPN